MKQLLFDIAQFQQQLGEAMSNMRKFVDEGLKDLAEVTRDLPENTNITQEFLAKRGWFIPFRNFPMSRIKWIAECSKENKNIDEIDVYLQQYVTDLIPKIIEDSEKYFSDRFKILNESYKAHDEERYALSIPTLLSQADGIFREMFGKQFYTDKESERNNIAKRILLKLNQNGHKVTVASFSYLFMKQLHEESSLHYDFNKTKIFEKGEDVETLNRHEVLHGIAKKYDSKINSLKALSLIALLISTKKVLIRKGAV